MLPQFIRDRLTFAARANVIDAWFLWAALFVVVSVSIASGPTRTVTGAYREGANAWMDDQPIYNGQGIGFVYFPQAAIAFIPVAILPTAAGEILWRAFTIGMFAWGIWAFCGIAERRSELRFFPIATLITLPLCWSAARNGQSTLPMAGMMMLCVADLADKRWSRAALWLCLGLAIKPLILVLVLLAGALYALLRWRLIVGLAITAAVPFFCQHPSYVLDQYVGCWDMLRVGNKLGNDGYWAQLFGLFRAAGLNVAGPLQSAMRMIVAVGTLGLCIVARRRLNRDDANIYLFALAAMYLMLFNPRTENNTYALYAPVIGLFVAQSLLLRGERGWAAFQIGCAVAIVGSFEIGRLFVPPEQAVWLAPLGCLLHSVYFIARLTMASAELTLVGADGEGAPRTDRSLQLDYDQHSHAAESLRRAA